MTAAALVYIRIGVYIAQLTVDLAKDVKHSGKKTPISWKGQVMLSVVFVFP